MIRAFNLVTGQPWKDLCRACVQRPSHRHRRRHLVSPFPLLQGNPLRCKKNIGPFLPHLFVILTDFMHPLSLVPNLNTECFSLNFFSPWDPGIIVARLTVTRPFSSLGVLQQQRQRQQ